MADRDAGPDHRAAPLPRFEAAALGSGAGNPAGEEARRALLATLPPVPPEIARSTCSITFLAGAGTRWRRSLADAKRRANSAGAFERGAAAEGVDRDLASRVKAFSEDAPRGLFPVPDFLRGGDGSNQVAMAAYAFDAVRRLSWHIVVVRGWEREIDELALVPAGLPASGREFFTQRSGPEGQVYGHGDAALQCAELWRNSSFVVTNFAGDANSALTVELALRAFARFDALGIDVGAVIPVACVDAPSYPVYLDSDGLPAGFWHEKLAGERPASAPTDFTNVGVRVYRAAWLLRALRELDEKYRAPAGDGEFLWNIPGNEPTKHECALDNVDNLLAEHRVARVMPISLPRELTPLKDFGEYDRFMRAVREVQRELSAARL